MNTTLVHPVALIDIATDYVTNLQDDELATLRRFFDQWWVWKKEVSPSAFIDWLKDTTRMFNDMPYEVAVALVDGAPGTFKDHCRANLDTIYESYDEDELSLSFYNLLDQINRVEQVWVRSSDYLYLSNSGLLV